MLSKHPQWLTAIYCDDNFLLTVLSELISTVGVLGNCEQASKHAGCKNGFMPPAQQAYSSYYTRMRMFFWQKQQQTTSYFSQKQFQFTYHFAYLIHASVNVCDHLVMGSGASTPRAPPPTNDNQNNLGQQKNENISTPQENCEPRPELQIAIKKDDTTAVPIVPTLSKQTSEILSLQQASRFNSVNSCGPLREITTVHQHAPLPTITAAPQIVATTSCNIHELQKQHDGILFGHL